MSDEKLNSKGKYETYECQVCEKEDESQEHIVIKCESLNESMEEKKYESIFDGNVIEKINIARKFIENIKLTS